MKISEFDILTFNEVLTENLVQFGEETAKILESNSKNSFRLLLDHLCNSKTGYDLDIEKAKEKIHTLVENKSNGKYQVRKVIDHRFWKNEIHFDIKYEEPDWGFKYDHINRINRRILEYKCEDEFWLNKKNIERFNKLKNNFAPYIDYTSTEEEIEKIKYKGFKRDHENWVEFLKSILDQLFPDFKYSKKLSNGVIRYLKPLINSGDLFFGFEFDQKKLSAVVKDDDYALPDYYNLILCDKDFKLKSQSKKYLFQKHPDILSLGIMGNPFCFPPCFPVRSFSSIDFFFRSENPDNNTDLNYLRKFQKQPNGKYKVEHPQEHGEKMKRHAYFYMIALSISVKPYLQYLEKSIIETVKKQNNA